MNKNTKLFGIAAALLALGLVLAGCPSDTDDSSSSSNTYSVTYDAGEGSGTPPASLNKKAGEKITLPGQGAMIAPEGYVFNGWIEQRGNGTIYQAGSEYTVSFSITFRAQWERAVQVTYYVGSGSGTAPESQSVAQGATITLPEQGDMIAPEGYVFNGWIEQGSYGTIYQAGSEYTVPSGYNYTIMFRAQWARPITITYDAGEGSGTPPASQSVKAGETITLPEQGSMRAPEGYIFNGWEEGSYGSIYQAGSEYIVPSYYSSITFTAQWQNKGIYLGLIRFAGDASSLTKYGTISDFYNLSEENLSTIKSGLSSYTQASQSGTALYYAVHQALANLTAAGSTVKSDIYSVNLITFTDGLDNGSFGASKTKPIEGKSEVTSPDYAAYIKEQIGGRTVGGKPINAYSIGIKGSDVTDETGFSTTLSNLASSQDNVNSLTEFSEVQATLAKIAEGIAVNVEETTINFNMQTPQSDPGTIIRMTFDINGTNPADAAAATRYIDGTLAYDSSTKKWSLTDVSYSTGISFENGATGATIEGRESGTTVTFTFYDISGYDPQTDRDSVKQWTKSPGSSSWQINSEYSVAGAENTTVDVDTTLICLVLDASTSLNDTQIDQVKTAVSSFIDKLYERIQP
jgi:hypothetical protein